MATALQDIDDKDSAKNSPSSKGGPPSAMPKPRSASDSSLFSTAGKSASQDSQSGLGGEGGSTAMLGMQGLALTQRGLQMINLAFPDNPGLIAILADVTGRLQSIIPQLIAQQSNGMGMGMFPQPQAPLPGAMAPGAGGMPGQGMPPPGGAPPMAGMGAPPMGPAGGSPMGGPPMPPMRPPGQ